MDERENEKKVEKRINSDGSVNSKRVGNNQDRQKKAKQKTESEEEKRRPRSSEETGEKRRRSHSSEETGEKRRRPRSVEETGEKRRRPHSSEEAGEKRRRPHSGEETGEKRRRPRSSEEAGAKRRRPRSIEETGEKRRPHSSEETGEKRRRPRSSEETGEKRPRSSQEKKSKNHAKVVDEVKNKKHKKKSPVKRILLAFFLLIIIAVGAFAALYWTKYGPGEEKADINEYYGIENETQLAIILDNEVLEEKGRMIDGIPYVNYTTLRDHINSRFYLDIHENALLYTLPDEVVKVTLATKEARTQEGAQGEEYSVLQMEESDVYVALEFVQTHTNIDFETFDTPNRVSIITQWGDVSMAEVKSDTPVRRLAGVKSPILTEINKNDQVVTLEDEGDWKKVRTADGFIGYVKKNALQAETTQNRSREFEEPVFTNISRDYIINLGWHQVTSRIANQSVSEVIEKSQGMNVISPTWFSIADNTGNITSLVSVEYVNAAHQANMEVWALVDNFSPEVDSHELLTNASSRENMSNQLVEAVLQAGIDGINLDFESLREETGEHYVQFIRELSVKCRANGIVLSVDNYVPRSYTAFYNRKEQGVVADYVIIMGYDEHYSGSLEAGPVASFGYVEEGILSTIAEVPAEKVINGVPFYTRIWSEEPKTEEELASQAGTAEGEYPMKVSSTAMGMVQALETVQKAGAVPQWDDVAKLDYATWEEDGVTYKVWLENVSSMEPRLQLMQTHGLAGNAAWKLGFETPDIWEMISEYVN